MSAIGKRASQLKAGDVLSIPVDRIAGEDGIVETIFETVTAIDFRDQSANWPMTVAIRTDEGWRVLPAEAEVLVETGDAP